MQQSLVRHNQRAILIFTLCVVCLAFVLVLVLSYFLIVENSRLHAAASEAESRVAKLTTEKADLAKSLDLLRQNKPAFVSDETACPKQTINIGLASYKIPCSWQSYFDIRHASAPISTGYLHNQAITLVGGVPDGTVKVKVELTRYAALLGNYNADPLSQIIASFVAIKKPVKSTTNSNGTLIYEVTKIAAPLGELSRQYTQRIYSGDVFLLSFEYYLKDAESVRTVIDSIKWEV